VRIDLREKPAAFFEGPLRLPGDQLRMIDEITGFWPAEGGAPGRIRTRQEINPHSWYFKAHFYEDPVQPGTLGLEALLQAVKSYLVLSGAGRNLQAPRFEPIALGEALTWKYRGQVVPRNKEVVTCMSVTVTETDGEVLAVAEGTLWADGLPIYEVKNMAVRIVGTPAPLCHRIDTFTPSAPAWVGDHCPTYALPALPMMAFAAEAAAVARDASGRKVTAVEGLRARRWVPVADDGVRLIAEARAAGGDAYDVKLVACTGGEDRPLKVERHEAASGRVTVADAWPPAPAAWPALGETAPVGDAYASGHLFHGPAFHLQRELRRDAIGASAVIEIPIGTMSDLDRAVLILDAALHGVPHDEPELWLGEKARGMVAYPEEIKALRFFADLPKSGRLRVEARLAAPAVDGTLPVRVQVADGAGVIAEIELVERLLPKGPLGDRPADQRRAFLAERRYVPGFGLSTHDGGATRISLVAVQRSNFLPGTMERVYGATGPLPKLAAAIAVKEHFAERLKVHPSAIDVGDGEAMHGRERFRFTVKHEPGAVVVTSV
jgi:3-hydroxymyristoyl/3-hydroxydecanoyl-(acyl carrier protein) dehydratase